MLRMNKKGFTLIELMIVVAIIGILAAVAIPMYRAQTVKAKMSEGIRAVDSIAGAVGDYYNDNSAWPPAMTDATAINNTLGVGVDVTATSRLAAASFDGAGVITAQFQNVASDVDTLHVTLTGTITGTGAVSWTWASPDGLPAKYMPKK